MITDEELKQAFALYRQAEPTPERREAMDRLYHKRCAARQRVLLRVVTVVVCLLGMTLMAPVASAACAKLRSWFALEEQDKVIYTERGELFPLGSGEYELGWIPEEYQGTELISREFPNGKVFCYLGGQIGRDNLLFEYFHNTASGFFQVHLSVEEDERQVVTVNGKPADMYIKEVGDRKIVILMWESKEGGTLFQLASDYDPDYVIEMAEGIKRID